LNTLGEEGRPTYEDLKSMKYLQYCLNEGIPFLIPLLSNFSFPGLTCLVLRLYPIVPFNVRTALKDTTLPHGGGPLGIDVFTLSIVMNHANLCSRSMWRKELHVDTSPSSSTVAQISSATQSMTSTPTDGQHGPQVLSLPKPILVIPH
jgi:hypothetical protein